MLRELRSPYRGYRRLTNTEESSLIKKTNTVSSEAQRSSIVEMIDPAFTQMREQEPRSGAALNLMHDYIIVESRTSQVDSTTLNI